MGKAKSNILDSRWIFKRKKDEAGNIALVSRLPLVRSFLAIANKNKLYLRQLDVETAFLYEEIDDSYGKIRGNC